ncbi:MAG: chromosomal replication initiator protein DnaA [Candidatus Aphodomorpha sp.]
MEHLKIWARAREEIRPQMTGLSFHAWIDSLVPLIYKDHILVLEVPNPDILKTLKDFYFEMLFDAARKADDSVADVLLVLPEDRDQYVVSEDAEPVNVYALNPKYTFDSFIVGGSNQFPHAAAQAVAQNPGIAYNPLFIYGGVGLGKTHLMHAIGHFIKEKRPSARVMYVTSETFTNELITAIQQDKRLEFRKRYRNVDILMIDDVQFISRSQATQEEFFNTFNTLHNANKQIVISSDRPPKEISKLEERLCSRFQWGLITDIQPPDLETRIAILRNRARLDNIDVDDAVLEFIADHVQSNIRELEGCLTRVVAYSRLRRRPLNLETTADALKDLLPEEKKPEITPQLIKETVAEFYSISVESMDSQRRDREVVMPRQIAMYLCHGMLSLPYKRIAYLFNRNDHTTAMSACEKIDKLVSGDPKFASVIEDIKKRMKR